MKLRREITRKNWSWRVQNTIVLPMCLVNYIGMRYFPLLILIVVLIKYGPANKKFTGYSYFIHNYLL